MPGVDQWRIPCEDRRRFLVDCDPFWPVIDLHRLREQLRLSSDISAVRLEVCARIAMAKVAKEFRAGRMALRGQGYRTLLDLPADDQRSSLARSYWCAMEQAIRFELETGLSEVDCVDAPWGDCQR